MAISISPFPCLTTICGGIGSEQEKSRALDGFTATVPVRSLVVNGHGPCTMVDMSGNWTAAPFRLKSLKKSARIRTTQMNGSNC